MPAIGFQRTLNHLLRTPNQSAAGVLEAGMLGPSPGVRNGAIAAWARRKAEPSQRQFLAIFHELSASEVASLSDLPRNFRSTIRKVLQQHDPELNAAVCELLLRCQAFDEFPSLVESAADREHPGGDALAATTLQLSFALHDRVLAYRQDAEGRDPSFARRWALTALVRAVDRFAEHGRIELVESFLLVTTPDNHTLLRLLTDETHPCHKPLAESLRTSRSSGAIELLAAMFADPRTPLPLLEIAAHRGDICFRSLFLETIGYPANPRAIDAASRVRKIVWLEKLSEDWFELPAEQQATALQLAAASRLSRRSKMALADWFLDGGAPLARLAACELLASVELPESMRRLEELLDDSDPRVVAAVAEKLRRKGFVGVVPRLARLLDHADASVRQTAQSALRDFTFMRFLGEFDKLEEADRIELGRIVTQTDPDAKSCLSAELRAATISRKNRGLQMTAAMGFVDELLDELLELAKHPDVEVRCESITALAGSRDIRARQAMDAGLRDHNASVVNRATEALAKFSAASQGDGSASP